MSRVVGTREVLRVLGSSKTRSRRHVDRERLSLEGRLLSGAWYALVKTCDGSTMHRSLVMAVSGALLFIACASNNSPPSDASASDSFAYDAAPAGPCTSTSDCPGSARCYFAIADGCGTAKGTCFLPAPFSPLCKGMPYCDCAGNMSGDCTAPSGYFPTRVSHAGYCVDGGSDSGTD